MRPAYISADILVRIPEKFFFYKLDQLLASARINLKIARQSEPLVVVEVE